MHRRLRSSKRDVQRVLGPYEASYHETPVKRLRGASKLEWPSVNSRSPFTQHKLDQNRPENGSSDRTKSAPGHLSSSYFRTVSEASSTTEKTDVPLQVFVWGDGTFGQLGFGEDISRKLPARLTTDQEIMKISAGGMHSLLLCKDNSLLSFGVNDEGALGRQTLGPAWEESSDYDISKNGDPYTPTEVRIPDLQSSIIGIGCTDSASFVFTSDGSIFGWGSFRGMSGRIGFSSNVEIQNLPVCIYKPETLEESTIQLIAGGNHVIAVLQNGKVLSWGDGDHGQLGRVTLQQQDDIRKEEILTPKQITNLNDVKIVAGYCGEYSTFLQADNGRIFACGLNNSSQLGIPLHDDLSSKKSEASQGTLLSITVPIEIERLNKFNVIQIAPGARHTLILNADGEVYSFGSSSYGALGIADVMSETNESLYPYPQKVNMPSNEKIVHIAAGQDVSGCISIDGKLLIFGGAHAEQMCISSGSPNSDIISPTEIPKSRGSRGSTFCYLDFGGQHGIMLGKNTST